MGSNISTYTEAIAEDICARIANGETLNSICSDAGMPAASTVRSWANQDVNGFAALSARAYALGYETLAEECLQIADTPEVGVETTTKPDGSQETREGDMLGHRRLKIDTRMRLLGKWAPKRYGEKLDMTLEVTDRASQMQAKREARLAK